MQRRARPRVGVLTVDDKAVFRDIAREVIEATAGFEPLGEASCGEEALALANELDPDLVLLDVRMPGIDGLETARRLSASHPESTVVLISSDSLEGSDAVESLRCGGVPPQAGLRAVDAAAGVERARPSSSGRPGRGSLSENRPRSFRARVGPDRKAAADRGAAPGGGFHGEGSSQRRDAVGHVREPVARAPSRLEIAPASVVFDLEEELCAHSRAGELPLGHLCRRAYRRSAEPRGSRSRRPTRRPPGSGRSPPPRASPVGPSAERRSPARPAARTDGAAAGTAPGRGRGAPAAPPRARCRSRRVSSRPLDPPRPPPTRSPVRP